MTEVADATEMPGMAYLPCRAGGRPCPYTVLLLMHYTSGPMSLRLRHSKSKAVFVFTAVLWVKDGLKGWQVPDLEIGVGPAPDPGLFSKRNRSVY